MLMYFIGIDYVFIHKLLGISSNGNIFEKHMFYYKSIISYFISIALNSYKIIIYRSIRYWFYFLRNINFFTVTIQCNNYFLRPTCVAQRIYVSYNVYLNLCITPEPRQ